MRAALSESAEDGVSGEGQRTQMSSNPETELEGIEVCRGRHAAQAEVEKPHHDVLKHEPLKVALLDLRGRCSWSFGFPVLAGLSLGTWWCW